MNATKRWLTPASLTIAKSILSCSVGILFMGTLPSASLAADTFNAVVTKDKPGKAPKKKPKKNHRPRVQQKPRRSETTASGVNVAANPMQGLARVLPAKGESPTKPQHLA